MRRLNLILLLSAVTAALAFVISCKETNAERLEKMCGEWVSTGGKPPFTLWEEDGKYRVIVLLAERICSSSSIIFCLALSC